MTIRRGLGAAVFGAAWLVQAGCSSTDTKGGVMVAVSTDLAAPKDIDQVGLFIAVEGKPLFAETRPVAPDGTVRFPATLAVAGDPDRPLAVTVRAVAFSQGKPAVLRDVLTTIPTSRVVTLRVPLHFLGLGSAVATDLGATPASPAVALASRMPSNVSLQGVPSNFDLFLGVQSNCPAQNGKIQTNVSGTCRDADLDSNTLPLFEAKKVFGGGESPNDAAPIAKGYCFDATKCFASVDAVSPNLTDCVVTAGVPAGVAPNFALRTTNGSGTCTAAGCFVPLDHFLAEEIAERDSGWWSEIDQGRGGSAVHLPAAVCASLALPAGDPGKRFDAVVLGTGCDAWKNQEAPLCGPASATDGSLPPPDSAAAGKNPSATTTPSTVVLERQVSIPNQGTDLAEAGGVLFVAAGRGALYAVSEGLLDPNEIRVARPSCSTDPGRHQVGATVEADGVIFVADAMTSADPGCNYTDTGSLKVASGALAEGNLFSTSGEVFFDVVVAPGSPTSGVPLAAYFLSDDALQDVYVTRAEPPTSSSFPAYEFRVGVADVDPAFLDLAIAGEIKRITRSTFESDPTGSFEVLHDFGQPPDSATGTIVALARDAGAFYAILEDAGAGTVELWRYDLATKTSTKLAAPLSTNVRAAEAPQRGIAVDANNVYFARDTDVAFVRRDFASSDVPIPLITPSAEASIAGVVAYSSGGKRKVACLDVTTSAVQVIRFD